jgi:hypothetical protein
MPMDFLPASFCCGPLLGGLNVIQRKLVFCKINSVSPWNRLGLEGWNKFSVRLWWGVQKKNLKKDLRKRVF